MDAIFEKIASKDKDYRYMATSDLLNELQRDSFHADPGTEKRICQVVLHQMEDASGDISNLAVKCLAPLVKRIPESRLEDLVEGLATKLLTSTKEQQRDVGSIGLKTVIAELSTSDSASSAVRHLAPKLAKYLSQANASLEVKSECLEILCDTVHRFGLQLSKEQEELKDCILPQLDVQRAGLRKRAIACVAGLAATMPEAMLVSVCEYVLAKLDRSRPQKSELTCTYVQALGAISRSVGYRFGKLLPATMPVMMDCCSSAAESDDEMRENALQALESVVLRCSREVAPYLERVLGLCLEYLRFDPNYSDGQAGEEEGMQCSDGEDDDVDEDSEGEYSDDEDSSWKTRRAAAKCLGAISCTRPEMLEVLYAKACPALVARFREREESVKIDIFAVFVDLLRHTGASAKKSDDGERVLAPLRAEVSSIIKAVLRQLKEKSVKTKVAVFALLKELVMVLPNGLTDHIGSLLPYVERALSDKSSNSNLKIEALLFLRLAMASHPPTVFQQHISLVAPAVYASVGERYYKVTSEALRVCSAMIGVIRPPNQTDSSFDYAPYVEPLYNCMLARLTAQDQDQEVKECVIMCIGKLLAALGDRLTRQIDECLPLLLERLRNEITRLAAVKAFSTIAQAQSRVDLSSVITPAIQELASFMRKANRALRLASLSTLNMCVVHQSSIVASESLDLIVSEAVPLISDADLQLASNVLQLCNSILTKFPGTTEKICGTLLAPALQLVQSPLLQGSTLTMLQEFFASLVRSGSPSASFDLLLEQLVSVGLKLSTKHTVHSVALCVAGLCTAAGKQHSHPTVTMLMPMLKTTSNHSAQLLALLCLGEIGRRQDLAVHTGLESVVTESFNSPSEEIKSAAAYALGSIAVGNLNHYLPYLLEKITSQAKLQYFLLYSLKEVITPNAASEQHRVVLPSNLIEQVLALLFQHCESSEEGVRNVVADCLGKLTLMDAERLLPSLQERLSSPSPNARATMVMSLKCTISDKPQPIDAVLQSYIDKFLLLITDDDRHVRRAAVQVLHVTAHNKAIIIHSLLPTLLPLLYEQTVPRPDLVRTVDLGPFKHTVDDGLELRKSAFECMDTLLDSCLPYIDTNVFLHHLKSGLADHYDVKLPCHLILAKLAVASAPAVLGVLTDLVEPLEKTLNTKLKTDAVKQEVDRNEDMLRSALRAIDALSRMSDHESCQRFSTFLNKTVMVEPMATRFNNVRSESDLAVDSMDMS